MKSDLQYMRSMKPSKKNSAPLVIYDVDEDLSKKCCICFISEPVLINPCQCNMQYHQTCILRYIREKLLSMKQQLDFSQIRCQTCKHQIRFMYHEHTHYSCTHFCNKLKTNWCNKILIFMVFLLAATIALGIILAQHNAQQGMIYYGLIIGQSIVCFILLLLIIVFIQTNLTYKQIILVKVYQYAHIMRNNSSSSDDSPHQNYIASETLQIIIDQQS